MNITARTLRASATATGAGLLLAATGAVLAPGAKDASTFCGPSSSLTLKPA
ncbi:hypothetical protein [Streptomyces sp. NPDC002746]